MKKKQWMLLGTLMVVLLGSCVSSKKFKGEQVKYIQLQTEYATLQDDLKKCNTQLQDDLKKHNSQSAEDAQKRALLESEIEGPLYRHLWRQYYPGIFLYFPPVNRLSPTGFPIV